MKFTLVRNTGIIGMLVDLDVHVNGQKVGSLKRNEIREFTFEGDSVELRAGQSFMKSEPVIVQDGGTVVAKSSFLNLLLSMSILFFFFFYKKVFYLEFE